MAIKVNGTTVIDDSRNLSNVGGLKTVGGNNLVGSGDVGFKTVNGDSLIGSGNISAGASTTNGDVGTYTYGCPTGTTNYGTGATASGIYPVGEADQGSTAYRYEGFGYSSTWYKAAVGSQFSGTWRCMSICRWYQGLRTMGLWVRIS
jgi:hypothetical protein